MIRDSLAGLARRGVRSRVAFCALTLSSIVGCGSESSAPETVFAVNLPIYGGQSDPDHTSVVGMYTQIGQYAGMCSGTLIAPNLVLTARHCVSPLPSGQEYVVCGQSPFGKPYAATNMRFTPDIRMRRESVWYGGVEVRVPSEGSDTCGFDVALVILQGAGVPAAVTQPYVPRIDREVVNGEEYQAIGYGQDSPDLGSGGGRRILSHLSVRCSPGTCNQGVASSEWVGETGVCQGDSGGPALDTDDKVVGVVSRGSSDCGNPVYGAISSWKTWITDVALDAAARGGYPPPFWAVTGSSDPAPPGTGTGGSGGEPPTGGTGGTGGSAGSAQGASCANTPCPAGYACITEASHPQPFCTASCDASRPCSTGLECDAALGICRQAAAAEPPAAAGGETASDGGCSVGNGRAGGPIKPVPWIVGLGMAALALFRRPVRPKAGGRIQDRPVRPKAGGRIQDRPVRPKAGGRIQDSRRRTR